ncbi:MAG: aminotransferase class V-fold PLP-dependent enzyme, partial [Clostridia bacterium]|nr:aminotransferase class V-fold PLP-dependent enzyme [Clostridia bacterium]
MIYLDNAATTKVYDEIIPLINKYLSDLYFNPSALYSQAIQVACDIKRARQTVASILGIDASTIFFTSSGTESDNHVLFTARKRKGTKIIISATEYSAVYNAAMELKQQGYDIAVCKVKSDGSVDVTAFAELLDDNTSLISIMHVNNETGAVNDIEELVRIAKAYNKNILFHSDGVQAYCKIPLNLIKLGVDFYSISGHKIGAPKGIAALYVKKGVHLNPLLFGGGFIRPNVHPTIDQHGIGRENFQTLFDECTLIR